nr:hypothetical protein Iba_chr04aCG16260 [Ipomoea batatas]
MGGDCTAVVDGGGWTAVVGGGGCRLDCESVMEALGCDSTSGGQWRRRTVVPWRCRRAGTLAAGLRWRSRRRDGRQSKRDRSRRRERKSTENFGLELVRGEEAEKGRV